MELAEILQNAWAGFSLLWSIQTWLAIAVGVIVGLVVGALPGLNATMAIALLSPLTFFLPPLIGIPFLVGIYKGSDLGGFVPAILIRTPGTSSAAATLLDGYPLAQKGYPNKALQTALTSSVTADCLSDFVLLFSAPFLAIVAISLGVPERFAIIVLSLAIVGCFIGGSAFKGLVSAAFGLLLASIGVDEVTGSERFLFGYSILSDGIGLLPSLIGLFALSEVMRMVIPSRKKEETIFIEDTKRRKDDYLSFREFLGLKGVILRSTGVGTLLGAAPGIGPTSSAFVCYSMAKRVSKHPEEFGKGTLEGIAASEAGNSAVSGPNLIPLLTLGIPGSLVAAVLYGAFLAQGLRPGPELFQQNAPVLYGLIFALIGANVVAFFFGKGFMGLAKYVIDIPRYILAPIIIFLAMAGTYAVRNEIFDLWVMVSFGLLGFMMDRYRFPAVPLIIAFILGRALETSLIQSLIIFRGNFWRFFEYPICAVALGLTVLIIAMSVIRTARGTRRTLSDQARPKSIGPETEDE